jgi:hypothetical protein
MDGGMNYERRRKENGIFMFRISIGWGIESETGKGSEMPGSPIL